MNRSTIVFFLALIVGISATNDSTSTTRVIDRRRRHARVDGSTPCLTEQSCRERYTALYNAGVITGYLYSNSDAIVGITKGCIIKGDNVYYTLGTMEEMTAPVAGSKKTRLYCLPEEEVELDLDDMSFSMILSLSMPSTKASKPFIEAAELSLSLPEELSSMSFMSMPLGTKASKPNRFIDAAEFSLSMTELSTSIMSMPGAKASKPGPRTKSLPIKVSAISMTEMSMPDMSMSFAADSSMSMLLSSVPMIETSQVDMSMPIELSMSMSMPSIELNEMSMSMMSSMPDLIQFEVEMDTTTTTTDKETDEEVDEGFIENIKDETTGFFENATDTAAGFFQNATDTVVDLFNGGGKNETDEDGVEESTSAGAVAGVDRTLNILCAVASVIIMVIC